MTKGLVMRLPKIEMLREAPPRSGFVDEAQYQKLVPHLRADPHVVIAFGNRLGWRVRSEVLTLERRQVDLDSNTVRPDPGQAKNKEGRVAPLTPELRMLLASHLKRVADLERALEHPVPWVFPHLKGALRGRRIESFTKEWKRATGEASLPGLLVHDLRRSAVRNMERAGVPRSVAKKITGHKTESMYSRYAMVSENDLQDAGTRIDRIGILGSILKPSIGSEATQLADS